MTSDSAARTGSAAPSWDAAPPALRDAFEHAPVGLAMLDRGGRWRHVNAALARLLERPPAALVGRAFTEVVHPADRARDADARAAIAEGQCATLSLEQQLLRQCGSAVTVRQSTSAVRDPAGALHAFVLVVEDLTTARAAQAALHERETEFRAMADNIPQLAWMADAAGRPFWYNRRWYAYTGTSLEAMRAHGWDEVHHPAHVACVAAKRAQAFAAGTPWEDTFPLRAADGSYRWFLSRANPIRDGTGHVVRWFGTHTDVTAELEAREEAERARREAERQRAEADRANRAKSAFLAVMSHELRTPLNAIQGYAELLTLGLYGDVMPRQREVLERIRQSERHLLALVDDVLHFARLETGRTTYAIVDLPVGEALEDVAALAMPLVARRAQTLVVEPVPEAWRVRADRGKLRQLLLNLVANAVKFTPEGGRVTLAAELAGERVRLHVTDTGAGVDDALRETIFEPFVQGDASLTRQAGGVGLGLAIARELAHGMDGTLALTATAPQAGSTFTLTLPCGAGTGCTRAPTDAGDPPHAGDRRQRAERRTGGDRRQERPDDARHDDARHDDARHDDAHADGAAGRPDALGGGLDHQR